MIGWTLTMVADIYNAAPMLVVVVKAFEVVIVLGLLIITRFDSLFGWMEGGDHKVGGGKTRTRTLEGSNSLRGDAILLLLLAFPPSSTTTTTSKAIIRLPRRLKVSKIKGEE